jgi:non-ribosomal peptide synthetase component E (peptide arylation enzyme)
LRTFINAIAGRIDNLKRKLLVAVTTISSLERKVAADHIRRILSTHLAVVEVGVIEIFYVFLPRRLFVVVSLNKKAAATARQLEEYCRMRWGDEKRIGFWIHIAESLPKLSDGTIDKQELMREHNRNYFIPSPG